LENDGKTGDCEEQAIRECAILDFTVYWGACQSEIHGTGDLFLDKISKNKEEQFF
jgi:hypothetical protein